MNRYQIADEKIMLGYNYFESGHSVKACDAWLSAWEEIKNILATERIEDLQLLQNKYKWSEFLSNYIQDVELELYNAGLEKKEYFHKRIKYCHEMIKFCGRNEKLIIENAKRAIATSYFELGDKKKGDELFSQWLDEDPTWGWGYIGWSRGYSFGTKKTKPDYTKAEEIIRKAVERNDVRDKIDVLMEAIDIYVELNQNEKADELREEMELFEKSSRKTPVINMPYKADKVGRNEPCPCGSGKKYKKCCENL